MEDWLGQVEGRGVWEHHSPLLYQAADYCMVPGVGLDVDSVSEELQGLGVHPSALSLSP